MNCPHRDDCAFDHRVDLVYAFAAGGLFFALLILLVWWGVK